MREAPTVVQGTVSTVVRGAVEVRLANGHVVRCTVSGKMDLHKIRVTVGDKVVVAMTPYHLHRRPGRPSPLGRAEDRGTPHRKPCRSVDPARRESAPGGKAARTPAFCRHTLRARVGNLGREMKHRTGMRTAGCLSVSRAPRCPTGIFPAPGTD
jgi:translation initiation factor IF-1